MSFNRMSERMLRTDWTRDEVRDVFELPFLDLVFVAQAVHRQFHQPNKIELAALLSIKTGGCPEDCGYCSQSAFAKSGVKAEKLMGLQAVEARAARANPPRGRSAFAWGPPGAARRTATLKPCAR
jgi:biotin synthase